MPQDDARGEPSLDREIDLDIVSASWRSLTHSEGYEDLIEAWHRKLANVDENGSTKIVDSALGRQLGALEKLLEDKVELVASDPIEQALQETLAPAMVLSPSEVVVGLNKQGIDCFNFSAGAEATRNWLRADSVKNYEAILRSVKGRGNANYAIIRCIDQNGEGFLAETFPLSIAGHDQRYILVRSLELDWSSEVDRYLAQAFGLTNAECDICRLLFQLRGLDLVAEHRSVALGTVRSQLKQIFIKLEVRSKVELIRLIGLICARAGLNRRADPLHFVNPLNGEMTMRRSDGRALAYSWTGAANGKPVLYAPGAVPYFLIHSPIKSALIERDIKLIYISFPGHGLSEGNGKVPFLEDASSAIIELCDHLRLSQIAGLASYAGHICLSRAASLRPDLFHAHLSIGINWNLNDQRLSRLPLNQRTLAKMARVSPSIFSLVCKIGLRRMKEEGPDFFLDRSFSSLTADRISIRDPEMQPMLRLGCQHLVCQGPDAFIEMQSMVGQTRMQNWMKELPIPTHFLIPQDVEKQDRKDFDDLKELGPLVTWETVPSAGELLPFQTPELFLDALTALTSDDPRQEFLKRHLVK